MPRNELGMFLRERRGTKSLRDFSKELGISHTHLDSIEKGFDPRSKKPVNISVDTINKLSEKLGVSSATLLNMVSGTNYQKALGLEYAENKMLDEIKRKPSMTEDEKDIYFMKMMDQFEEDNNYSFSVKKILSVVDYQDIDKTVLSDKKSSKKLLRCVPIVDIFCKFFTPLGKEILKLEKEYADKTFQEDIERKNKELEASKKLGIDFAMFLKDLDTSNIILEHQKYNKLLYIIRQNYSDEELMEYLIDSQEIRFVDENNKEMKKNKKQLIQNLIKCYAENPDLINSLNKTKQRLVNMLDKKK